MLTLFYLLFGYFNPGLNYNLVDLFNVLQVIIFSRHKFNVMPVIYGRLKYFLKDAVRAGLVAWLVFWLKIVIPCFTKLPSGSAGKWNSSDCSPTQPQFGISPEIVHAF
jgi:hypothetical protein